MSDPLEHDDSPTEDELLDEAYPEEPTKHVSHGLRPVTKHTVMIVPMIDLIGKDVFAIECSCTFVTRGYTSKEAAQAGGQRHVARHTK